MQVNQRRDESKTFPAPGLSKHDGIALLEKDGNGLHLDRGWPGEASFLDFGHEVVIETKLVFHLLKAIKQQGRSFAFNLDAVLLLQFDHHFISLILEVLKLLKEF